MIFIRFISSSVLLFLCSSMLFSQPEFMKDYPDTLNKKRQYAVIAAELGVYATGLSFLSFVWYKDHERVPFHYYDDSKGYLQMDKAGHAYSAYQESAVAYYALRWSGMSKKKALLWGGPVGLVFQTPVEIFDGKFEGWGFSWSDMVANTFGSALFTSQELLFNDQHILMKFSYSPSIYPSYHHHLGETQLESFFLDYNAHTYWLSGNITALTGIKKVPKWLNIAFGYSANGMIYEFENPIRYQRKPFPHLERYRQYILSLDIDFNKIKTNKKWLKPVLRFANTIKIPFPALEYNRIDGFTVRGFYF